MMVFRHEGIYFGLGNMLDSEIRGVPVMSPDGEIAAVCIAIEEPIVAGEQQVPVDETEFVIQNMRQKPGTSISAKNAAA